MPPPPEVLGLGFFRAAFGFTLAEVLITLAIIGVVAVITMPNLIQHHKKQETSARLKKFYSMMSQAILMSEIENGPVNNWERKAFLTDEEGGYNYEANGEIAKTFFLKYIAPFIKYTNIDDAKALVDEEGNKSGKHPIVYLPDSSYFYIMNSSACMDLIYDTNGNNKPNKPGKDIYSFLLCKNIAKSGEYYCPGENQSFCAFFKNLNLDKSRAKRLSDCKINAGTCSGLLQMDGWEFKEDYPYKL